MSIKVAINGFGRIGRLAFRKIFDNEEFEVVAINDLTKPEMLAYLLKYDSVQGAYRGHTVEHGDDSITVDGKLIPVFSSADPAQLPWGKLDVDIVLECTGFFASKAKSQAHIDAGAKKVLISAPAGNDLPTIVYGVNHNILTKDDNIVSGASCTTNCLAPMAKALNDYRELRTGFMTTIHAYTGDQMILDLSLIHIYMETGDYQYALDMGSAAGSATAISPGLAERGLIEACLGKLRRADR